MKNTIYVDIVLICYNHEKYIAEAIESVVSQKTKFPFHLYIGDDASTDKTPDIIRTYAKKYPHIITPILREKNLGANNNYLDLVSRCHHKYIAFLEGDDAWCNKHKLQMQVAFLEKHPKFTATSSWCNYVDRDGNILLEYNDPYLFQFKKHIFKLKDYQNGLLPGCANTIVAKNIFSSMNFDWKSLYSDSLLGDQINFFLLVHNGGKIYCCHKKFLNYRYRVSTVDSSYSSLIFQKKEDHSFFMYKYFNKLENQYEKLTGKYVSFQKRMCHHFYTILHRQFNYPNKADLHILLQMIHINSHKLQFFLTLMMYVFSLWRKKIYHLIKTNYSRL